jgi:phage gp45-like
MSRARNRADGDFGDLDITNIGAVSLDSIKGDADGNTSLAFSGSDVITITTGGTTAMTIDASQNTTLAGTLTAVTSVGIGSAVLTEAELEFLDGITAGTAAASKVLVLDSIKNIATIGTIGSGNITSSGTIQGTTITATTAFVPDASDGAALGTSALEFSDLFLADGAVISLGDDDDVTLTHVADTGILLNSTMALQFNDASQFINAPSATVLDINATDEIELNATLVDINANLDVSGTYTGAGLMTTGGNIVIPDAGTIGSASDTNAIGISSGGVISITATTANTSATDGALTVAGGLGIAADVSIGDDLRLISDAAVLGFGADTDVTLTHVADTGVLLNAAMVVQFRDSAINIGSPADGDLDINADDEIELNSTLIDINGNVEISGTTAQVGVSTSTAKDIFNAGMSVKNGATSAGFVEFFEDSDNGTNKVTVIGPASTADVTLTLPNSAGTIATTATAADEATALAIALG